MILNIVKTRYQLSHIHLTSAEASHATNWQLMVVHKRIVITYFVHSHFVNLHNLMFMFCLSQRSQTLSRQEAVLWLHAEELYYMNLLSNYLQNPGFLA